MSLVINTCGCCNPCTCACLRYSAGPVYTIVVSLYFPHIYIPSNPGVYPYEGGRTVRVVRTAVDSEIWQSATVAPWSRRFGLYLPKEVTITLAAVAAGQSVTVNGLTFTADVDTTAAAVRQFTIAGDDTADAAELVACLNDPIAGVPSVTATAVANVITLRPALGTTLTASASAATLAIAHEASTTHQPRFLYVPYSPAHAAATTGADFVTLGAQPGVLLECVDCQWTVIEANDFYGYSGAPAIDTRKVRAASVFWDGSCGDHLAGLTGAFPPVEFWCAAGDAPGSIAPTFARFEDAQDPGSPLEIYGSPVGNVPIRRRRSLFNGLPLGIPKTSAYTSGGRTTVRYNQLFYGSNPLTNFPFGVNRCFFSAGPLDAAHPYYYPALTLIWYPVAVVNRQAGLFVALAGVKPGQTITISGVLYTAHATTTTPAARQFSIAGTDAQDASALAACINDPSFGHATVAATTSGSTVILTPKPIAVTPGAPSLVVIPGDTTKTVVLTSVASGDTLWINGLPFAAAAATTPSQRRFSVGGGDAADAVELAAVLNHATYGVAGVTATALGNTVTLAPPPLAVAHDAGTLLELVAVQADQTVTVNGAIFTAAATTTSPADREFAIAGTDAEDAAALAECINDPADGAPQAIATAVDSTLLVTRMPLAVSATAAAFTVSAAGDGGVVTVLLASVAAGNALTINGGTFAAHATTTTPAARQFSIAGTDAEDAAALAACINDPADGAAQVTATSVGALLILTPQPLAITHDPGPTPAPATVTITPQAATATVIVGGVAVEVAIIEYQVRPIQAGSGTNYYPHANFFPNSYLIAYIANPSVLIALTGVAAGQAVTCKDLTFTAHATTTTISSREFAISGSDAADAAALAACLADPIYGVPEVTVTTVGNEITLRPQSATAIAASTDDESSIELANLTIFSLNGVQAGIYVELASVAAGETLTVNGLTFTAHATTTTTSAREFSIAGTNAADASALVTCINHPTYGAPGVTAARVGDKVRLLSSAGVFNVSAGAATMTVTTTSGYRAALASVSAGAALTVNGLTFTAHATTTTPSLRQFSIAGGDAAAATALAGLLNNATWGPPTVAAVADGVTVGLTSSAAGLTVSAGAASITVTPIIDGETLTIDGLTFTAHATTTTESQREFFVSGSNAADAVELARCINDSTSGVPDVTATVAGATITLRPAVAGQTAVVISSSSHVVVEKTPVVYAEIFNNVSQLTYAMQWVLVQDPDRTVVTVDLANVSADPAEPSVRITLTGVAAGAALTVNGLTFTAHATTTTTSAREFSVTGNDAADAAALAGLLNDATYGVPTVSATVSGATITLHRSAGSTVPLVVSSVAAGIMIARGAALVVNDLIFSAHSATIAAERKFAVTGNDAADAAALAGLLNDATYGVPDVRAAAVGARITLVPDSGTPLAVTTIAGSYAIRRANNWLKQCVQSGGNKPPHMNSLFPYTEYPYVHYDRNILAGGDFLQPLAPREHLMGDLISIE